MAGNEEDYKEIKIPASLYKKVEARLEKSDFNSVSDYITFLVREVLENIEKEETGKKAFTPEEEKEIEERLRNLGYID